jgi:glucose/arabinose dehydrogenase
MRSLPLLLLLAGCAGWFDSPVAPPPPPPPPPSPPPPPPVAALRQIGTFANPTFLAAPPGDTSRVLVTERAGRVLLVKNGVVQNGPFLDLRGKISAAAENGLYSLAFHPQYAANGRFYAFYTNLNGDIRVVRYVVSSNPDSADESQADTILAIPHPIAGTSLPFANHHGGQLQFGPPPDGKLYVSLGDGGCCGDPLRNGQRKQTVNGKLLRIDVSGATGYTVPSDNPFVTDTSYAPEIWAVGFRNPWRFSFDRQTGDLYIGDIGDATWEEIDVAAAPNAGKGINYGWSILEGTHCLGGGTCNQTGLTPPVTEYQHVNNACSVTGGYVYRGTRVTQLIGHYLYADYCAGFVLSFRYAGGQATQGTNWTSQVSPGGSIVSFGEDARGELYIVTYAGPVYRIVAAP